MNLFVSRISTAFHNAGASAHHPLRQRKMESIRGLSSMKEGSSDRVTTFMYCISFLIATGYIGHVAQKIVVLSKPGSAQEAEALQKAEDVSRSAGKGFAEGNYRYWKKAILGLFFWEK
jgi:hypothetical protein